MEHSIFISYSSADKSVADQVCAALEQAGYDCWIAPRDIEPGADYPAAILAGVQGAQLIVVIISAAAVASPHILSEIGHAFSEKKPILPFRLSEVKLPPNFDYFLSTSQWLDAHDGCTPGNLSRLKEAVSRELAGRTIFPITTGIARGKWIAVLAAAFVLIATGAIVFWRRQAPRMAVLEKKVAAAAIPQEAAFAGTKLQTWINPKDGLTYVWMPPDSFSMGCSPGDSECQPDENPRHLVELPEGFWLGQTEVTNAAYHRLVQSSSFASNQAKLPAVGLSWIDAKAYCAAAGGRLPSEAEWEYAARGGIADPYYGVPSKIAWYAANSGDALHEVGTLQPNAYGLYDMLGNASEWVLDRYYNKYDIQAPATASVEEPLASNATAVTRGGFWESVAADIRASRRNEREKDEPAPMSGVRCVIERK
jgi:formylglycine-generating enzyme required for sulfatase activity